MTDKVMQIKFSSGDEILTQMSSKSILKNPVLIVKMAIGNQLVFTLRPWMSLQEKDDEIVLYRDSIEGAREVKSDTILNSYNKFLETMEDNWSYSQAHDLSDIHSSDSDELLDYLESLDPVGEYEN
jgi:hypothetical protein